ncbi:MAG TPA: hypothetical protein VFB00_08105, partial [Terriglobales bacterium]|nr:hypothetical protein [Terriglobales bacterium]
MKNKSYYNPGVRPRVIRGFLRGVIAATCLAAAVSAWAGDAPQWMHALVNAPLPPHDDKTDAVLLYSERNVNVISTDKIKTIVRRAYKILRPDG